MSNLATLKSVLQQLCYEDMQAFAKYVKLLIEKDNDAYRSWHVYADAATTFATTFATFAPPAPDLRGAKAAARRCRG